MNYWDILGIEPTVDLKVIKKAYASKLRLYHPEDDPKGFQNLREAYDNALKEAKYIKEVKSSISSISEVNALLDIKFKNNFSNLNEENNNIEFEEENIHTNDEDLVDTFMSRVNEIYNDFFKRIDVNRWKAILEDQTFWVLSIRESLCNNMLEFLMDNYYLPHNVWCLLNEYFSWIENGDDLYERFDEKFIGYIFEQVRNPYGLRYEFFKKDYKCNYDKFIALRNNAYYALIENNLEECIKTVMPAMELFPDDPDLVRILGNYYLRIEDSENAKQAFSHLIEINPKEIDGHLNRGYILIKEGMINEAYYDFQNALNIIPDNISALNGLAECYFYFNNLIEAKLLYSQIREACVFDIESRLRIVEINAKLIDKYNNELTNNPKNIDTKYELAKTYFEMEAFEECRKTIEELIKDHEVNSDVYLLLGRALAGMGYRKESLEYFDKAMEIAVNDGSNAYEILFYRGLVNLELKKYKDSINDFESTLKINQYNAEALNFIGRAYMFEGKCSKTVELCSKAISINPSKWRYYSNRGIANFILKNYEQSRDDHDIVIKHKYSFAEAWYRKGYCHLQLAEYEDAIECFKEAIDWKEETHEDIHLRLSLAYFKSEDFQSALTEVMFHCEANSNDIFGLILMGDIYRALGISSKAKETYLKALELKPKSPKVLKLLTYYYIDNNDLKKAFEYLDDMIYSNKNDEEAYIVYLWLCSELNKIVSGLAAIDDYEELLKRNKKSEFDPYALFYYSVILYKKGFMKPMYKAAAEKIEKAIGLGLENGVLLSYLSMIYYELGDSEKAIKYAKEALDTNPSSDEYKIRYEGVLQYAGKRNFFVIKMRPSAKDTWPVTRSIKPSNLKYGLLNLNISLGENYEEDV